MLTHLLLRDLVIVDQAELELRGGLTALTGETGAGKSIVVDALLMIAGGRAQADVVRQGAERAEVSATFGGLHESAVAFLESQSIDYDGELIVRRVIGADGRSRAYLNGQVAPLSVLKELSGFLIEIHGQQEFQRLVSRTAQRDMLDERLADAAVKSAVAACYEQYRACRRDYDALEAAAQNRDARLDLLRYQVQELKGEVSTEGAIEELFADQKRISGKGRLGSAARDALQASYEADGDSAHALLARAQSALRGVAESDEKLAAIAKQFQEAAILTQEAGEDLRRYLEELDIDPARQEQIERQAAALESLARKHRVSVLQLPEQLTRLETELTGLDNASTNLAALKERLSVLSRDYASAAARLSKSRQSAAEQLGREVTQLMQALGMAGGSFAVTVVPHEHEFASGGVDEVEFLVSANPGQPLKGLAKVASGGELSRISLAVQVASAGSDHSLAMVFDEVDAGIGGAVAEIVGRRLRELGERGQVLCVTHLAQVASQAHQQFRVTKLSDGKTTRTALKALNADERTEEIARMLGGVAVSAQARAHAQEMLDAGAQPPAAASSAKKKRSR
jgi:DNA repair protein RecN (Recombination protein N)